MQQPLTAEAADASRALDREKWSVWKSANIGLLFSAFTLLLQIGGGRGFELEAHYRTAAAVGALTQVLVAPLVLASRPHRP